jgi:hypothetical protein
MRRIYLLPTRGYSDAGPIHRVQVGIEFCPEGSLIRNVTNLSQAARTDLNEPRE